MNSPEASNALAKLKSCTDKLCSMKVKDNLDFSMTVTSKNDSGEDEDCFYKKITSNTEFSLLKIAAVAAAMGLALSLICSVCSMTKKK